MFNREDLVFSYSRAQAIQDGVLVDVSETARGAGFRWPVALARGVWDTCVAVPEGVACQDEGGRLWDVLWMLRLAIGRSADGDTVRFAVHVRQDDAESEPPLVELKALCGPGD